MRTSFIYLALFLASLLFYNCSDDDPISTPDREAMEEEMPEEEEEEEEEEEFDLAAFQEESIEALTDGKSKVWKIVSATLENSTGSIDITDNFNVTDDEFIFTRDEDPSGKALLGSIEWRRGNAINLAGSNPKATELDFQVSPAPGTFEMGQPRFTATGPTPISVIITDTFEKRVYENSEYCRNKVTGAAYFTTRIAVSTGEAISLRLEPKEVEDYKSAPSTELNFTEAFSIASNGIAGGATGMVASLSDNSIFISMRESQLNNGSVNPERVIKYDLGSSGQTEQLDFVGDFVSKQLHIINNELKVIGGQFIKSYSLDLSESPIADPHALLLSRFGTAVKDNEMYLVGGDLDNIVGNKIFKWDDTLKSLDELATMPEARYGARAEIVDNALFIFGGTETFATPPAKNSIYIYDFETDTFATEELPKPLFYTNTARIENLIYVSGQDYIYETDADGNLILNDFGNPIIQDFEPFLGVYDTRTSEFTELATNLSSPGNETIHAITAINGKLYIIYGQPEPVDPGELQSWTVLAADM